MLSVEEKIQETLKQELEKERNRADRAEVDAQIAWEAVAHMRELITKYKVNITALRDYEPIKMVEGDNREKEIERRLLKKRLKMEGSNKPDNGGGQESFKYPPHCGSETLEEEIFTNED